MGILSLDERHVADLEFLKAQSAEVLAEFAKIALSFLHDGANERLYASAGKRLDVSAEQVAATIEALAQLFLRSARQNLSENDFYDTLVVNGFSPETAEDLGGEYKTCKGELRLILKGLQVDLPHLKNMEWRLDVQVASRSLVGQLEPVYVTRWDTEKDGKVESQFLQLNHTDLKHVADELEAALKEMRSAHVRRVMRNVRG